MSPFIHYDQKTATATAYPSAACQPGTDLATVWLPKHTAAGRKYAEAELRRMCATNEARLIAERTAR